MNDMRGVFVLLMLLINIKVMYTSNVTCPDVCPRGKESWIKRGVALKCVNSSSYHCIEIVEKGLCELCFPKFKVSDAGCPKLRWDQGSKQYYQAERNSECPVNIIGCPNPKLNYTSDELYKFPQCNGNNQSAIDETRSTQHIPPSTQPTEFTESLGNNTSSENGDDSTNHAAVISLVVVLVLVLIIVGVLPLVCKRKVLINWFMAKIGRRTSETQTDGAMFKSNPSKKEKTSNSVTQETIVQIEESGRDNSVVGHEAANEATVPLLTNDKQTEEKKEHVVIQNTDSMGQSNSLSTNLKVNEIINGGTAQEKHIQLEASRNKNPTRHAFVETLRATYRKGWWVLRCKVSVEDIPCTWFRTHKNTDTEIHDGTEFKIFSIGTYRILHIQGSSGFDGRFRCELEDGSKEEIDVDFDETKTIQVKAGEACTLIRVMDETGMECKWLRNDDLIQRNEHFHIAMSNNESRLTIANVQSNDETTFRSKIGDEIQFYTIEIQDVEDSDSHQTLRKTLDDSAEDETTPKTIDVPHSEDAQHTVESNPPIRKVHEQHQELKKILGQVFCATEWDKITSLCTDCASCLKNLPQPVFEKEDLRALRNIVRQSTSDCQLCVAFTFMTLSKLPRNFDNIPEYKSIVGSGIQKEQKTSISTLIDFGKDFKTETDDIIAKLMEKTDTFQNKIIDIENDIDVKKVYPTEKDCSICALSCIAMNLTGIVKLLSNIKHSLSSLTNFLGNYVRVSPTPQEYSTLLPILRKMSKNVSKIDVLDSIAVFLDNEFKEVYHKCNSPTRRNETQADETDVNGDQQVLGERVNVR